MQFLKYPFIANIWNNNLRKYQSINWPQPFQSHSWCLVLDFNLTHPVWTSSAKHFHVKKSNAPSLKRLSSMEITYSLLSFYFLTNTWNSLSSPWHFLQNNHLLKVSCKTDTISQCSTSFCCAPTTTRRGSPRSPMHEEQTQTTAQNHKLRERIRKQRLTRFGLDAYVLGARKESLYWLE